jgi:hypothetical protein
MRKLRVFKSLLRWLPTGIFSLILLLALVFPAQADTGTYRISNYVLTLEPQSSGRVKITCEQEWKVLGGHIPWITVGLPNSDFSVGEYSLAAAKVRADNSGSWSGVRIDLDRDYLPGETFKIKFSVLQGNLLERLTSEKKWRIVYTPGWYDNAITDHLQINLVSPVGLDSYSSISPTSTSTQDNVITWEKTDLARGGKFTVSVECLDGNFLSSTVPVKSESGPGGPNWRLIIIVGVIFVFLYLIIMLAVRKSRQARDAQVKERIAATEKAMAEDKAKREEIEKGFEEYVDKKGLKPDAEGRYYDRGYGDYITPVIWGAVLMNQQRAMIQNHSKTSTHSCACACVSCACACACACAGGGAAGCSRKSLHQCRKCSFKDEVHS